MNVGVRELHDELSRHLAEVHAGRTITVTDHGVPIARIVPVQRPTRLETLIAEGRVSPAKRPKHQSLVAPLDAGATVSDLIGGR